MADLQATQKLLLELQKEPKARANNVVTLISTLSSTKHEGALRAVIQGLKVFFSDAGLDGQLMPIKASQAAAIPEAVQKYRSWVCRQYKSFVDILLKIITSNEYSASIQVAATSAAMECVRSEQGPGNSSSNLYVRLLSAVCTSGHVHPEVFSLFFTKYLRYADLRYFTLWTVKALAYRHLPSTTGGSKTSKSKSGPVNANGQDADAAVDTVGDEEDLGIAAGDLVLPLQDLCHNLFDVLSNIPGLESCGPNGQTVQLGNKDEDVQLASWSGAAEVGVAVAKPDRNESARMRRKRKAQDMQEDAAAAAQSDSQQQQAKWLNPRSQKRMYSDAWLALLALPIPESLLHKVLLVIHETVIPGIFNPGLLSDFLTHCLDSGGMTGMLALHGIFMLVTQHGLEYPQFYARLYNLITMDAFASKHRAQFFRLTDVFLSSPKVPAYTIAAITKRLARLALRAPPGGALMAVAFIHNTIRRHPSCMHMLHKPSTGSSSDASQGNDPYDETQVDPANSRAVESSLWEIEALRNHQSPHVAALVSVLDRDLSDKVKTSEVDIAPLLTTSYASLFQQEVTRRIKQVPIAFYSQQPKTLFGPHCAGELQGWKLPEQQQPTA